MYDILLGMCYIEQPSQSPQPFQCVNACTRQVALMAERTVGHSPRVVVPLALQYFGRVWTPSTSSLAARVVSMTATSVCMMILIGKASLAVQK